MARASAEEREKLFSVNALRGSRWATETRLKLLLTLMCDDGPRQARPAPPIRLDSPMFERFAFAVKNPVQTLACVGAAAVAFALARFVPGPPVLADALALVAGATALLFASSVKKAKLEAAQMRLQIARLQTTDTPTGLPNRLALMAQLPQVWAPEIALAVFDIDRIKRINFAYGHVAGDQVIKVTGERLVAALGDLGLVARIGGEEFALLTHRRMAPEVLEARLEAARAAVAAEPVLAEGEAISVSLSAGVSYARAGELFEGLYACADRALGAAKAGGRNRLVAFDAIRSLGEVAKPQATRSRGYVAELRRPG